MGDYRNDLQSALAQIEALRAENAALRARARQPLPDVTADAAVTADASVTAAPAPRRPAARLALKLGGGVALVGTVLSVFTPAPPADPPLRMPYTAAVPVRGPAAPLPMPPTTVRLPERPPSPAGPLDVFNEITGPIPPASVHWSVRAQHFQHWPDARRGLYVVTTVPDAECTVGGVRFQTPRPVFLEPGAFTVRCEAGRSVQSWNVRIESRQVTFDLGHRIGQ
jgi:hypothetical protein